jgi:sigma-B regulation protein RsbU (phosphoserine phosphatase)
LFLYTDGLSEVFNTKGDEYGLRRVEALIARHSSKSPEQMLAACLSEVRDFSAGVKRTDDLTLLVMQHSN